jgi:hypothetical protein
MLPPAQQAVRLLVAVVVVVVVCTRVAAQDEVHAEVQDPAAELA